MFRGRSARHFMGKRLETFEFPVQLCDISYLYFKRNGFSVSVLKREPQ